MLDNGVVQSIELTSNCNNIARYDLHMHSTFSDGEYSPEELVQNCFDAGLTHFALTDHDTVAGVARAQDAAHQLKINCIPGIELSAQWNNVDIHIVGLNIDPQHEKLLHGLEKHGVMRAQRARKIAEKLCKAEIRHTYNEAKALSGGDIITRAHFAQVLINRGIVQDFEQAFKKYLGKNKIAYVPTEWVALQEAITWIRESGGVAVLAHPMRYRLSLGKLRKLVRQFAILGGQGIELISKEQNPDAANTLITLCLEHRLYASQGSDFHGPNVSRAQLGGLAMLPDAVQPVWKLWENEGK